MQIIASSTPIRTPSSIRWQKSLAALGQISILAGGLALACVVRRAVASDATSDETALALMVATVALLLIGAALSLRFAITRAKGHRLSLLTLPIGILLLLSGFVYASLSDLSIELEAAIAATQPDPPSSLTILSHGHDIRLAGDFVEGTAHRLALLLDKYPAVTRIHLTSEGGLAGEGQEVGDVIAAHHLATYVPDYCVSACTLAFVRGHERLVLPEARVGFHAPYQEGLGGTLIRDDGNEQRAAYLAAGLPSAFVAKALNVKPEDIWIPTIAELRSAHVITEVVDRSSMPDSTLDEDVSLAGARAAILRNFPELTAVADRSPRAIDLVAAWYLDAYRQGRSEGENTERLQSITSGSVALTLSGADDPTLLEVVRYLATAVGSVQDRASCLAIAGKLDLVEAATQVGKPGDALVLLQQAILRRGDHQSSALPDVVWPAAAKHQPTCADWRKRLTAVLALPSERAAAIIRSRLTEVAAEDLRRKDDGF